MKPTLVVPLLFAALTCTHSPATAQSTEPNFEGLSLRQREFARRELRQVQNVERRITRLCGTAVPTVVDWQSFRPMIDRRLDGELNTSFYTRFVEPLDWLSAHCSRNDDAADAFRARFHRYRVVFDASRGRALEANGDELVYYVDFETANNDVFIREWFGRNL